MMRYEEAIKDCFFKVFNVATEARAKGLDPRDCVEITPAADFSERVEVLTGPPGVGKVVREYTSKGLSREEVAFKVAEMIADGYFAKMPPEKLVEQATRTGLAIITSGIVAGPVEGIDCVRSIKSENGEYAQIIFNGPIRSCGGTAMGLGVMICAHTAKLVGFQPYKPTQQELGRYIEEMMLYPQRQYIADMQTLQAETEMAVNNCYVAISSGPSLSIEERRFVSVYKNIPTIDDHARNYVRDTVCLVLQEGLFLKAPKLLRIAKKIGLEGWDWLANIGKGRIVTQVQAHSDSYLAQLVGGRPVFSVVDLPGGFSLRYGRSRHGGLYCFSVHPSVTYVLDGYPALGVQLKTSYPSKGATLQTCVSVEPPFVRLKDGRCKYLHDPDEARELSRKGEIEKILFLGEILISAGDVCEAGNVLLPGAWCIEWYVQYLEKALNEGKVPQHLLDKINEIVKNPSCYVSPEDAFEISLALGVPLHPRYTYAFRWASIDDIKKLQDAIREARDPTLPLDVKKVCEDVLIEHSVENGKLVIGADDFVALKYLFKGEGTETNDPLEYVKATAGIVIYDKHPTIIGCRMGRPPNIVSFSSGRRMKPPVHVLFPVGTAGGPSRLINKAAKKGKISIVAMCFVCPSCKETIPYKYCPFCGVACEQLSSTPASYEVDLDKLFRRACERVGVQEGELNVKGVIGLTSEKKIAAPLEKGILRAKYNLYCFRDETIRVDIVHEPLTAFRPKEIGLTAEEAKKLGYLYDIHGNPLTSDDQLVHMYPQDLILPEETTDVFLRMAKYTDEMLEKLYGMKPFYNVKEGKDLIGHLFLAISPHTAAALVLRLIGFTKARTMFNHPLAISERRRDADSDGDSVTLALPMLIDFSRDYLPSKIGMLEDTPVTCIVQIDPTEVDAQGYGVDIVDRYPLEFYEAAMKKEPSSNWRDKIACIGTKIKTQDPFTGYSYTHDTTDINIGETKCRYQEKTPDGKKKAMSQKIMDTINMLKKLRGVILNDVVTRMIKSHLVPDYKGCMRSYSMQSFRCTKCNSLYSRMPLSGKCSRCGRDLVQTVHKGTVVKYLWLIRYFSELINNFELMEDEKEYLMAAEQFFGPGTIDEIKKKTLSELAIPEEEIGEEAEEE